MLKTKYERMSREEKKNLLKDYKETQNGRVMYNRLIRLLIIGIIGVCYSIFMYCYEFKNLTWQSYLMIIPLFIISIIFIVMSYRLKKKVLNQFAIKKK